MSSIISSEGRLRRPLDDLGTEDYDECVTGCEGADELKAFEVESGSLPRRMQPDHWTSTWDAAQSIGIKRLDDIDKLRVVDCSVFPLIPSGNTHAPVVAVADRATDLILGKPVLQPEA